MAKGSMEEKQTGNNSLLWAFAGFVAIAMITVACTWIFRDFDASGYVKAVLDQHFHGEVAEAAQFVEGKSVEELYAQYEDGVTSFVKNNITSGVEIGEDLEQQYVELGKDIFSIMHYTVKDAEKISSKEYNVPVEYQTMNVFPIFIELVQQESVKIKEKAEAGEYQGSLEEINAQMQEEFLEQSYICLRQAYREVRYEMKETMIFKVTKNEEGLFVIDQNQIHDFTTKILGLDEIQD